MTSKSRRRNSSRLRECSTWILGPLPLIALYTILVLAPVAFAYGQGLPPRNWPDEISSALAMAAFAGLLIEFMLSGRFRFVSGQIGIDTTMRFHQLMARSFTVVILVHPFLYTAPMMNQPLPWDTTGRYTLGLSMVSVATGLIAWIALAVMVFFAIFREQRGGGYEAWRFSHGLAALIVAVFGTQHTMDAGRYSDDPVLAAYWFALLAIALFTLLWVYVFKPIWQRQHPYRVRSVRQVAAKTWELVLMPRRGEVIDFSAGQFVWLNVGHNPFSLYENPFSIASAPTSKDRLSFVIKEVGDFTRSIGGIEPGTLAYVDGPHGNLTAQDRRGSGIAMIAGGVGIAPLLSILRQLHETRDNRPVVLLYGNRVRDQIVYAEELLEMQKHLDLRIEHVLGEPPEGWPGRTGIIDAGSVTDILTQPDAENWLYFICGPLPMIESVEATLLAMGVPSRQIVSERFYYD